MPFIALYPFQRDVFKEQMTVKSNELEAMNESFLELNRRVTEVKRSIEQAKEKVEEKGREVRRWTRELSVLKLTRIIEDEEEAELEHLPQTESQVRGFGLFQY